MVAGEQSEAEPNDGEDDSSNHFYVSAGTVMAGSIGAKVTKVFDGGSVSAKVSDARNSAGMAVYQTTTKTLDAAGRLNRVDVRPSFGSYGTNPIYNDGEYKVCLYLPVSDENQQTAELYVTGWQDHMHYSGTTKSDNSGWLKMESEGIPFKDPGVVRYGDEFVMGLDDGDVATDSPGVVSYSYNTSDGKAPKGVGSYAVTVTSAETGLYESASATRDFTISKAPATSIHGHGTLVAVPLATTMGATEFYAVPIMRNGQKEGRSSRVTTT